MKHKRTKATEISMATKEIVWNRDNKQCIFCGQYVPIHFANSHFVKRSQGGLGIPQNITTACCDCHWQEDFGQSQDSYKEVARAYLSNYYGDSWKEENLIYKKETML